MYASTNATYSGNSIQSSYNYFPIDFNVVTPPSLMFRSSQQDLPDTTGNFFCNGPVDYSSLNNTNPNIYSSMESINEHDDVMVSSQSSPEYMTNATTNNNNSDYNNGRIYYNLSNENIWNQSLSTVPVNNDDCMDIVDTVGNNNDNNNDNGREKINNSRMIQQQQQQQNIKDENRNNYIGIDPYLIQIISNDFCLFCLSGSKCVCVCVKSIIYYQGRVRMK